MGVKKYLEKTMGVRYNLKEFYVTAYSFHGDHKPQGGPEVSRAGT